MSLHSTEDALRMLAEKETFEQYAMKSQYSIALASLDEAFATWQKEQLFRRRRFIQQNGVQVTIDKGYHVPFWQWWMNKLLPENSGE